MAFESEYTPILDRKKHKQDFDDHFIYIEKLLKDIVNYGSNLIPRCFTTSERKLEDAVIIGVLLRQVITMVDAAEILISNAAIYSSQLQARAGFEASIYIDWILKSDTEKKAKYYYVANLRKDRLWAYRTIGESPDQSQFDEMAGELSSELLKKADEMKAEAKRQIEKIDRVLSGASFLDVNNDLQNYKDQKRLPYEPTWYSPLGVSSVRQIAIEVKRLPEYEFFYSLTSEVMHSSRYRHHIQFGNGKLTFEPVRCLKGIDTLINFMVACTLKTYMNILGHYRPAEIPAFRKKYAEDWRVSFRNIKSVRYKPVNESTTI
jgi:hypothetical protein